MAKLGYLRVSTQEQRPDRQIDGLAALCDELFIEHASAATPNRPVFEQVLGALQPGDTLIVWDLDRAFRSVVDAVQTAEELQRRSIALNIVNLQVDTRTPAGMLVYTVLSACAAFERQIISQRTKEGMAAAKRRGKRIGRPSKMTEAQLAEARQRLERPGCRLKDIAAGFDVAPWTLRRALNRQHRNVT